MIPWRIMRPSIAHISEQLDQWCSMTDIQVPESDTPGLHPIASQILLISRPTEGRRLSWPEHTVGQQLTQGRLQMTRLRFELVT